MGQGGTIWLSFVMPFVVAFVTASITANLAVRRFKRERAWEKKEEAYFLLFDAINKSIDYAESFLELMQSNGGQDLKDNVDQASSVSNEARQKAKKVFSINYLFMSKEEVFLFQRLFENLEFHEYMDGEDMAELNRGHKERLLADAEKLARIELHAYESNITLLISTIARKLDGLLTCPTEWIVKKLNR
ncbi:hypothetical protein ACUN9Y_09770 [Halomonas sp. V046]|uniref:hypothetical protein n=1 Tax=Halomonas sp. V046 TaxID=3459611 RepID=UPI0040439C82